MIEIKDIEKLANLARLSVSDSEKERLRKDIDSILDYINQIKDISATLDSGSEQQGLLKNVFRDDAPAHESGLFTEALLAEAPDQQDHYLKVKKNPLISCPVAAFRCLEYWNLTADT